MRARAVKAGFDVARFASPLPPPRHEALFSWIAQEKQGEMKWMARNPDRRADPMRLMPDLGVIMVLGSYYGPQETLLKNFSDSAHLRIATYAKNRDYHGVLKKRMKTVLNWLREEMIRIGGSETTVDGRLFVDTAPVLEKPLAVAAGVGWQGKNSLLISRRFGCWLFLAEIFLTLPLPTDPPEERDLCGRCTRCLKVCPTDALETPYQLDATRCLAYWTIEASGAIPERYRKAMGNRVYGCDDCLTVCPWNRFAPTTQDPVYLPRSFLRAPKLLDFVEMDDKKFQRIFQNSPIRRIGLERFHRNLAIALGNWGDASQALPALNRLARQHASLVREHVAWGRKQYEI